MSESDLQRAIQLACSKGETRLFRNNVGLGWVGRVLVHDGDRLVLAHPRPLHAGLAVGSGDLIGWHAGRFVSVECKTTRGRLSTPQRAWAEAVTAAGGIAITARSVEDVIRGLK